jgi:hypothetical protein
MFVKIFRKRPLIGILCAVSVHVAFWFALSANSPAPLTIHTRQSPPLILVFVPPPKLRVPVASAIRAERKKSNSPPPKQVLKAIAPIRITPPVLEGLPDVLVSQDAVANTPRDPALLDIEALKRSVGKIDVSDGDQRITATGSQTIEAKLATRLTEGQRPKCDNDYTPKVGSVKFTGLMKLPFLVKDAVTNTGCKL